jgi:very-short-patch-repair endonuclease
VERYRQEVKESWVRILQGVDFDLHERLMAADECESPLEELFLVALAPTTIWGYIEVCPQYEVGPYRVDFLLHFNEREDIAVAVEIDGHDFHEKTREQAERDKKRDRYFAQIGMPLLRFTGREVWRDPRACVREAVTLLLKKAPR